MVSPAAGMLYLQYNNPSWEGKYISPLVKGLLILSSIIFVVFSLVFSGVVLSVGFLLYDVAMLKKSLLHTINAVELLQSVVADHRNIEHSKKS
jgi:hypothetical protein